MKKSIKVFLVILLALLSLLTFYTLNQLFPTNIIKRVLNGITLVLTPVLIALVLAYLVNPFTDWLVKKRRVNKVVAIILTMLLLFITIGSLIYLISSFIYEQSKDLINVIINTDFLNSIKEWFSNYGLEEVYLYIEDFIVNYNYETLIVKGQSILAGIIQAVTIIILVPIFLWHILFNKDIIFERISDNLPENWKEHVIPVASRSNEVVVGYFRSKIVSIVLLFVMFSVLYIVLGIPLEYVLFFAFLIAILDLIPYIGPTVGLLIPIVYIFSIDGVNLFYQSKMHLGAISANVILILVNFIIQLIQGNYIVPKLAGKEMNIHASLILIFMLFFGSILGIWGVVLSIPLGGIIIVMWNYIKELGILSSPKVEIVEGIKEEEVKEV